MPSTIPVQFSLYFLELEGYFSFWTFSQFQVIFYFHLYCEKGIVRSTLQANVLRQRELNLLRITKSVTDNGKFWLQSKVFHVIPCGHTTIINAENPL